MLSYSFQLMLTKTCCVFIFIFHSVELFVDYNLIIALHLIKVIMISTEKSIFFKRSHRTHLMFEYISRNSLFKTDININSIFLYICHIVTVSPYSSVCLINYETYDWGSSQTLTVEGLCCDFYIILIKRSSILDFSLTLLRNGT